ncbi:MAG: type II toxin-antitoxin system RelE/ParE family toxin [Verrucomicrobiota bacterium]
MKIDWSPLAIARVQEIADYISSDNPEAANHRVTKVFDRVQRLAAFPDSGRHVPEVSREDVREILHGN